MPSWFIESGYGFGGTTVSDGNTRYPPVCSCIIPFATEVYSQCLARDAYTLDRLYVRVITNTLNGATTVRSRHNGGNGNQSVSIGAGLTGVFEDNVNSDAIASGDTVNSQIVAGGSSGSIKLNVISYRLSTASNTTPILGHGHSMYYNYATYTYYAAVIGHGWDVLTESSVQLTFRVSATLSNLRIYVYLNNLDTATTVRTRKNGANGNQSVTIPLGTSGAFEDVVNTDNIVSGDEVNYQMVVGGSGVQRLFPTFTSMKSDSSGRQTGGSSAWSEDSISGGSTYYYVIENFCQLRELAEVDTQSEARTPLTAQNMFLNITSNTMDDTTNFILRQNGVSTTLVVAVGAGLTGFFEDLVHSVNIIASDLINFCWDASASTAGNIDVFVISFEQQQYTPPVAPPVILGGLANRLIAERII